MFVRARAEDSVVAGRSRGAGLRSGVLLCLLLPLTFLEDTRPHRFEDAWQYTLNLYHHGELRQAEQEAANETALLRPADQSWSARFQILQAELALWRGYYHDALQLLGGFPHPADGPNEQVEALTVEAMALSYQREYPAALQRLSQADRLCADHLWPQCGYLFKSEGTIQLFLRQPEKAWQSAQKALATSRQLGDHYLEGRIQLNLGQLAGDAGRYSEALAWDQSALDYSTRTGDQDTQLIARINMFFHGLAPGDAEGTREAMTDAIGRAEKLGDERMEIPLLLLLSDADLSLWHLQDAEEDARRMLVLARLSNDHLRILGGLRALIPLELWQGRTELAQKSIDEFHALVGDDPAQQSFLALQQGRLDLLRGRRSEGAHLLRPLMGAEQTLETRLTAAAWLGRSLATAGHPDEAEAIYRQSVEAFDQQMQQTPGFGAQVRNKLWASLVFSQAIDQLQSQGRSEEALRLADHYLNAVAGRTAHTAGLDAKAVARQRQATIFMYWMGREASWLWVVTPQQIRSFHLPGESTLKAQARAWRKAVAAGQEQAAFAQGRELWNSLTAPAASLVPPGGQVILVDDEDLSKLNFETLPVPGERVEGAGPAPGWHYWIEDVTLRVAPSLSALAEAHPAAAQGNRMLLVGDAQQATPKFPALPMAGLEVGLVRKHFAPAQTTVLTQAAATPSAWVQSHPERYTWMHFVAHADPGLVDPLDATIVLSRSSQEEDSWKLTARQILAHPLNARLVTLSACSGSGARYFSGQGMVGLSWAFQQAGAHNVIGTLWEVSDESSPQLMDKLYDGLQHGLSPAVALREARLSLLHGSRRFRQPFYWAPFQLYSRE